MGTVAACGRTDGRTDGRAVDNFTREKCHREVIRLSISLLLYFPPTCGRTASAQCDRSGTQTLEVGSEADIIQNFNSNHIA